MTRLGHGSSLSAGMALPYERDETEHAALSSPACRVSSPLWEGLSYQVHLAGNDHPVVPLF